MDSMSLAGEGKSNSEVTVSGTAPLQLLSPQDEEAYFRHSMQLLRCLQNHELANAFAAAEAMKSILGDELPLDSPANLLLSLRGTFEQEQQAEDEEDSSSSSEAEDESQDTSSSTGTSGVESETDYDESETKGGTPPNMPCETALVAGSPVLSVTAQMHAIVKSLPSLPHPVAAAVRAAATASAAASSANVECVPVEGDDKVLEEERDVLADIEDEINREMQRLAIVRKHR